MFFIYFTATGGCSYKFHPISDGKILAIFEGIFILGEKKTKRQMVGIIIGIILIIIAGVLLGFAKS